MDYSSKKIDIISVVSVFTPNQAAELIEESLLLKESEILPVAGKINDR